MSLIMSCVEKAWNSVADPDVGVHPPRGRDFAKFSQKMHEIERIWTPGGRQ